MLCFRDAVATWSCTLPVAPVLRPDHENFFNSAMSTHWRPRFNSPPRSWSQLQVKVKDYRDKKVLRSKVHIKGVYMVNSRQVNSCLGRGCEE
eukprot:1162017-Pelagomonas_calceolata.AAC.6